MAWEQGGGGLLNSVTMATYSCLFQMIWEQGGRGLLYSVTMATYSCLFEMVWGTRWRGAIVLSYYGDIFFFFSDGMGTR